MWLMPLIATLDFKSKNNLLLGAENWRKYQGVIVDKACPRPVPAQDLVGIVTTKENQSCSENNLSLAPKTSSSGTADHTLPVFAFCRGYQFLHDSR